LVMPCHDEEHLLPYVLPSIQASPIDELVVVLDRCTDHSEQILDRCSFPFKVRKVVKKNQSWSCPTAEVFELGFQEARGDLLFTTAADMVLDPHQFKASFFNDADFMSFFYYNMDVGSYSGFRHIRQWYENFLTRFQVSRFLKGALGKQTGHMALTKECWEKLHVKDTPSEFDDFKERALDAGFKYRWHGETRNFHLRAGLSRNRQLLQGISRSQRKVNPLMVLGHSVLHFKPSVFLGYLQEKKHHVFSQRQWSKEKN